MKFKLCSFKVNMPKKKVGSVHVAKNGARYKILPSGKAMFISGPTRGRGSKRKKKSKGGGVSVGGGVRIAGALKR